MKKRIYDQRLQDRLPVAINVFDQGISVLKKAHTLSDHLVFDRFILCVAKINNFKRSIYFHGNFTRTEKEALLKKVERRADRKILEAGNTDRWFINGGAICSDGLMFFIHLPPTMKEVTNPKFLQLITASMAVVWEIMEENEESIRSIQHEANTIGPNTWRQIMEICHAVDFPKTENAETILMERVAEFKD